ncbi:hypothetical protein Moror_16166 [Moniliophthora roreri MCA 2997]|uniref:LysM domain-containing protein n=2 Tax=Moniliophthora roreri TaxID=221103 RepID=V2WRD8_MONRO|nr:hypothetical protein Moror_16166 [Moniliophthora roreri MCA 2997]
MRALKRAKCRLRYSPTAVPTHVHVHRLQLQPGTLYTRSTDSCGSCQRNAWTRRPSDTPEAEWDGELTRIIEEFNGWAPGCNMALFRASVLWSIAALVLAQDSFFFTNNTLGPTANPLLSEGCKNAMLASISCDPNVIDIMTSDYYGSLGNQTIQDNLCNPSCGQALESYRSSVASACASDLQPFDGLPATYFGDAAEAAWKTFCLRDSFTGQYCTDYFEGIFGSSETDSSGTDLPQGQLCSECVVNTFIQMQSTPYSNYDDKLVSVWTEIQNKCSLSHNTTIPSLPTNITGFPGYALPNSSYSGGCLSGNTYAVESGDTCQAISQKKSVAVGTLISINNILPQCTNIFVGQELCLPQQCTTYTVQPGDTCFDIANAHNLLYSELLAYNPTINRYCTNLLSGINICVSSPGGTWSGDPIEGATPVETGQYATETVAPPGGIAAGTTTRCGKWYKVQSGDFCQLVALNNTITLDLFEAINPSINADCTNLVVGLYYCTRPTADWNETSSEPATTTTVAPPTATPSGTTNACFTWYVIQPGDFCGLVQAQFGITFAQLQFWNPSLLSDCSNLLLGEAYCVSGATQPPAADRLVPRHPAPAVITGGVAIGYPYVRPGLSTFGMAIEPERNPVKRVVDSHRRAHRSWGF